MANIYLHPANMFFTSAAIGTGVVLNNSSVMAGVVFTPDEDASVVSVLWNLAIKIGNPGFFRVGFQGVDLTTGLPDGVWLGYGDFNASTLTGYGQFFNLPLSSPVNVYRGQVICQMIQVLSGTWDASNSVNVQTGANNSYPYSGFPYLVANTTGTAVKVTQNTLVYPIYAYRSATKTYGYPFRTGGVANISSTTTPDEAGLRFTLPARFGKKFRLLGIHANHRFLSGSTYGSGCTFNLNLYDNNSNLLAQAPYDSDQAIAPFVSFNREGIYRFYFDEPTLPELSFGVPYIIAIEATNAVNQEVYGMSALQASDFRALTDASMELVTRKDNGAWTANTLRITQWQLIVRDITTGGIISVDMLGGMTG